MKLRRPFRRRGHDTESWPVLLLLLAVVLLPTAGGLWFMNQAMRNEQLAVRQKLSDVYQAQLVGLRQELQLYWQARLAELDWRNQEVPGSRLFAARVRGGLADSVVVLDPSGRPAYPAPAGSSQPEFNLPSRSWRRAERLEHSGQSAAAAARYALIAERATDQNLAARALLAQARCLVQAQQTPAAISILNVVLGGAEYRAAVDSQGRLIAPSAQLRALELIGDPTSAKFQQVAKVLGDRLDNYEDPGLPAVQRLFLMRQLMKLSGPLAEQASVFDTLQAEELAQRYLDSDPPTPPTTSLQPSGLPEVWHLAAPSGRVVGLYSQQQLIEDLESLISRQRLPEGTQVELLPPGAVAEEVFLVSLPAGGFLQDWQLVLLPEDQTLFAVAAKERIRAYRLTAALVVAVVLMVAALMVRTISRQLRLTRLKNDLLATVSHELKTPLASMLLLVDTLLDSGFEDGGIEDGQRVREYLQLIAKENLRLSRLVDNFLTFSRMEQGRQNFDRQRILPDAVVVAAGELVADRFSAAGCHFEVQVEPGLPALIADQDALVAVLLNLLDNAYKYSGDERHIVLRTYRDGGEVCFAVRDHGIGLSGRVAGKIFDRFYQVDQSLSRPESGCGLGLSIVQFIVQAHGGSVSVDSRPGEGSTFTVCLPAAPGEPEIPTE